MVRESFSTRAYALARATVPALANHCAPDVSTGGCGGTYRLREILYVSSPSVGIRAATRAMDIPAALAYGLGSL